MLASKHRSLGDLVAEDTRRHLVHQPYLCPSHLQHSATGLHFPSSPFLPHKCTVHKIYKVIFFIYILFVVAVVKQVLINTAGPNSCSINKEHLFLTREVQGERKGKNYRKLEPSKSSKRDKTKTCRLQDKMKKKRHKSEHVKLFCKSILGKDCRVAIICQSLIKQEKK